MPPAVHPLGEPGRRHIPQVPADAVFRQAEFDGEIPGDQLSLAAQPGDQQVPTLGS
jgi:hypothetical protein